ncbi:IQ domain-containing protein E-like isoform X2 [Mya arenaria]|uniref:IQ domain-containing protein E-like isoform X2 n=1 Tax=Mya arenaria TaxID=6604 RepID=UPI0022E7C622|nr:IQ domain-containing protein E-like isoform X2 [Mya arenaria]
MPGKYKVADCDDYLSDDLETADTLIGRNCVPKSPVKKKRPISSSTNKTTPRRPVTPGKKKKRPQSAPTYHRSGHELWMNAVKHRKTVGLSGSSRPQSPRHKTASEFWIDTLRKTGTGFTTESTGMNTFNGKRPRDKDMPYLSTPSYLRQIAGTEKQGKMIDPTAKASPGTPAYKSQEEYYEQILEFKRQVKEMQQESSTMRAKIRRVEEDNLKKEKEIDSLLHPHKSEELRRTLADKRPDSGSVIHSLKQKILKLETQLRDKEGAYIKLQSDLKTTKVEEMRQQMEIFYAEIVRLQNSKDTGTDKSTRPSNRESTVKVKALNETILRLNKHNEQLQAENRALKEDLKNSIDTHHNSSKDFEDMNRKELLSYVAQLELKLQKADHVMDGASITSYDSKAPKIQGKVALEGTLQQRLDQLDHRESELLDALERKTEKIKGLTEEKNRWKRRCEEIEKGRIVDDYHSDARERTPRSANRPPSARSRGSIRDQGMQEAEVERTPHRDSETTPRRGRPISGRSDRRPPSAKRRTSVDSSVSSGRRQRIQNFKETRSAKVIQRNWRSHQDQQQASSLIRAALMGHTTRRKQIKDYHDDDEDDYETDNEEYNECVNLIQSAMLGHNTRKTNMKNLNLSSMGEEEDDDDDDIEEAPRRRLSSSLRSNRPQSPAPYRQQRPQSGKRVMSASQKSYGSHRGTSSYIGEDDDDF